MLKEQKTLSKGATILKWLTSCLTSICLMVFCFNSHINVALNIFSPFLSTSDSTEPFYGENIDMSQILPTSKYYVVNSKGKDLIDIASYLGINLIRITNGQRSFDNNVDSMYSKEQWDQVLGKMQRKGIKAIIVIETASNNKDYYTPNISNVYLDLVQKYINSDVFSNPNVYAVDIKNEPILTNANVNMLQYAHEMIKGKYPKVKQTIGWWASTKSSSDPYNPNNYNWSDFSVGQKIANIVDFYSIHLYGFDTDNLGPKLKTKLFVSRVQNGLKTKKPILIEEFGEANGDAISDQDTIGSPQLQAHVYQGVYQALQEMRSSQVIGSVAFDFYSRNQYPDAWAIVKENGNYLFPAAYVLQEYALRKNNPSIQSKTVVTSKSYLVTNKENYTIQNLHKSDRIGFKLYLDKGNNYSLCLSDSSRLQVIDALHYDFVSLSYHAVYKALNKGKVHLYIIPSISCQIDNNHASSGYTMTINIQ